MKQYRPKYDYCFSLRNNDPLPCIQSLAALFLSNEKKLIAEISKAFLKMESAKKGYVNSVIELGERLLEAKEKVGHGRWENLLKSLLGGGICSQQQAHKYMQIAENKALVLEYFNKVV